ncbi:hypothetical protein RN001_008976 [Aquatica leii]|uniref:Thioredoxin domain-containing protein n=1 Tax=Aquatica leii TaxID=1421715 RepID=A0AAN7SRK4_9COLE|nr:hypothetical protein RN001_008976 [Aquatica leii]
MRAFKSPLQVEINSNYQWEKLLENEELLGLSLVKFNVFTSVFLVVDVYSGWCGPCTSMLPTLQKIKEQVGKDVTFATANADKITFLETFRDKSEPTWLLLVEGKIINVVYGSSSPRLVRTISSELKKEILIQKGEGTRAELEIDDISKEEPALIKAPPSKKPKETTPPPPVNPLLLDEEFPYRPFRITYFK